MRSIFSEKETEAFYDREDAKYRSFWDHEGSLHWGYLPPDRSGPASLVFKQGCERWNMMMLEASGITASSRVLDLGCGNGNTAIWLAQKTGCEVVGVDLSGVRVQNARDRVAALGGGLNISFVKGSVLDLPLEDNSFTHAWSQATFYHVPQRIGAVREAFRVLQDRGVLVFDDLVSPTREVNFNALRFVYERLLFQPEMSHADYLCALRQHGFFVRQHLDLSQHLDGNYDLLSRMAAERYPELSDAYRHMCKAIHERQVGWSFFQAVKIADCLNWVYEGGEETPLHQKYDTWAHRYDSDLATSYRNCPAQAAALLSRLVPHDAAILDAGCGTGMVAEALTGFGHANLTGTDQSAEMLSAAARKRLYRQLKQHDLHDDALPYPADTFDAVTAIGVFTFNHVRPDALDKLVAMLRPGGLLVVSARADYMAQTPEFTRRLKAHSLTQLARRELVIFGQEQICLFVLRKQG